MNNSYIIGIGAANPRYKLTQEQSAYLMAKNLNYDERATKRLVRLYQKTAIQFRHTVIDPDDASLHLPFLTTGKRMQIYEQNACDLAISAFQQGIDEKYLEKITHLITVSCTGMYAPGLDIELTLKLNLKSHVERTCINFMGCYGAINALKAADKICKIDSNAYVLIVCVEFCSLHFQPMETLDKLLANAIFADGAACALVHSKPVYKNNLLLKAFHCHLSPGSAPVMGWNIRDNGFDIQLSTLVPKILENQINIPTQELLSKNKIKLNDIDFFAIHPGGKEILQVAEKSLAISLEQNQIAHKVLRNNGNMSSPTILFILKEYLEILSKAHHGKNILALAFGPGLTIESALLENHVP
jgi:alpha-pyrone synthase